MLWKKGRRSDNVVDARDDSGGGGGGMRFGGGKGLSLTAIILIVGIEILFQALKLKDFIPFSFVKGCFQHRAPNGRE